MFAEKIQCIPRVWNFTYYFYNLLVEKSLNLAAPILLNYNISDTVQHLACSIRSPYL